MQTSFPKKNRLLNSKQYQCVFKRPKKFFSGFSVVLTTDNGLGYSRLGLVVKKKNVKRAVKRNALKRVVREGFRKNLSIVATGLDVVVIVSKYLPKKELSTNLEQQWKNILSYYKKS